MKCAHCNVELGEGYHFCPLCGNKAVYSKEMISARTASYPKLVLKRNHK